MWKALVFSAASLWKESNSCLLLQDGAIRAFLFPACGLSSLLGVTLCVAVCSNSLYLWQMGACIMQSWCPSWFAAWWWRNIWVSTENSLSVWVRVFFLLSLGRNVWNVCQQWPAFPMLVCISNTSASQVWPEMGDEFASKDKMCHQDPYLCLASEEVLVQMIVSLWFTSCKIVNT